MKGDGGKTRALVSDRDRVKSASIFMQDMFTRFVNEDRWDGEEENREREASGFQKQEPCA